MTKSIRPQEGYGVKDPRRETKSLEKNPMTGLVVELFGPTLEFLTSPEDKQSDFCVLKGTIRPMSMFLFTATPTRRTF
jgi:hypothetical protein